jgi:hypothetical protein
MSFNLEALGVWTAPKHFTVERDRVAAYAAATNDPIPEHLSGEHPGAGAGDALGAGGRAADVGRGGGGGEVADAHR